MVSHKGITYVATMAAETPYSHVRFFIVLGCTLALYYAPSGVGLHAGITGMHLRNQSLRHQQPDELGGSHTPHAAEHSSASCTGVPGLGQWQSQQVWVESPAQASCNWSVPLPSGACHNSALIPWATLRPLSNKTYTFIGDSTTRELRADLWRCLAGWNSAPPDQGVDGVVALPPAAGGGTLTLRYFQNWWVRSLLDTPLPPRGVSSDEGEKRGSRLSLREALRNASAYQRFIGDGIIVGAGFWHMRDVNSTHDNGGHERYPSLDGVIANYVMEIDGLAAEIGALPSPFAYQLRHGGMLWWRETTSMEWVDGYGGGGFRAPVVMDRINAAAHAAWGRAGVPLLHVHQYGEFANETLAAGSRVAQIFTRDGTHLHDFVHFKIFREVLSALVDAAGG